MEGVERRARGEGLLVEGSGGGRHDAGRDAVVGDVEEAARTCRGADEGDGVCAREGEVDDRDGEGWRSRRSLRGWHGGCGEEWRHGGDAGLHEAADAGAGLVEPGQLGLGVEVASGRHLVFCLRGINLLLV